MCQIKVKFRVSTSAALPDNVGGEARVELQGALVFEGLGGAV